MKYFVILLSFCFCLPTPGHSEANHFKTDRASPLKLAKPEKESIPYALFKGRVTISGRFHIVRDPLSNESRHLRVVFYPDKMSAALLPYERLRGPVKELLIENSEEAASILLDSGQVQMIRTDELLGATLDATITIGKYQSVVECDQRFYLAELISASLKQKIVVGARGNVRVGCG